MPSVPPHRCPICQEILVEVEAALNRSVADALIKGLGSSELQIRRPGAGWSTYMTPHRDSQGLFCVSCGALTLAPSDPELRRTLGLEP